MESTLDQVREDLADIHEELLGPRQRASREITARGESERAATDPLQPMLIHSLVDGGGEGAFDPGEAGLEEVIEQIRSSG